MRSILRSISCRCASNDRDKMIAVVCKLHARFGAKANVGLGFYQGLRFHIDTNGFRRWGSELSHRHVACVALEAKG